MRRALAVAGIAGLVLVAGMLGDSTSVQSTATLANQKVPLSQADDGSSFITPVIAASGSVVGATWATGAPTEVEVRSLGDGVWSDWQQLITDEDHAPDDGTAEASQTILGTEATAVGDADSVQFRVEGDRPSDFNVTFVSVERSDTYVPSAAAALTIQPRSAWDPDNDCPPRETPEEIQIDVAFVHHTGIDTAYPQGDVPGIILGYCLYHRNGRGWNDIAYNFLIDRFGTVWEGRAGGTDRGIRGGHTKGFNSYSTGIALIGNFTGQAPSPAQEAALTELLTWKLDVHNVDPYASSDVISQGSHKWDEGVEVSMDAVSGHRDAQATACPGSYCYNRLGNYRDTVASAYRAVPLDAYGPVASGDFVGNGSEDGVAYEPASDSWVMFDGGSEAVVSWGGPNLSHAYTTAASADLGGDAKRDVVAGAPGVIVDLVSTGSGFSATEHTVSGTPIALVRANVGGAQRTVALTSSGAVLVGPGFGSIGGVGSPKDVATGDLDGDGTDEIVVLDGSTVRVMSPDSSSSLDGASLSISGADRIIVADFEDVGTDSIAAVNVDSGVATLVRRSGSGLATGGSVDFLTWQHLTEVFARDTGGRAQLIALDSYVGEWKAAQFDGSGSFATILEDQAWRTHVQRDGNVAGDSFLAFYGREFGWLHTSFGYGQDDDTNVTATVSGSSRYSTNVAVNKLAFSSADHVVLATSENFPDALAAGAAAAELGGTLLLTATDALPSVIADEIIRLGASSVTIAGGTVAVSPAVEAAVAALGVSVGRVGGANRYETAALLSSAAFDDADVVYIATGLNYPDALAGVPAAAKRGAPILLVGNGSLPTAVISELNRLDPSAVYILGGPVAVSGTVADQIASVTGLTPTRLGGANRYETAVDVSADAFSADVETVFVAPGTGFLDALIAGPVADALGGPVLLVPDDVPGSVYNEVMRLTPDRIILVGGALDDDVSSGFDGIGPSTSTTTLGNLPR